MPKFIFVTGGVVSSVGKGITTASLGRILKSRGVSVSIQKLDPYLNVDPGTMSPYQHGEVFVTSDGAETDLDLGHYERFLDQDLTAQSSVTSGQVYLSVLERERRGDYLGGTIQAVPHLTNEIKARIRGLAESSGCDVLICEVGGTVGDIEGQSFIEAIRQRNESKCELERINIWREWVTDYTIAAITTWLDAVREQRDELLALASKWPTQIECCDRTFTFCGEADLDLVVAKVEFEIALFRVEQLRRREAEEDVHALRDAADETPMFVGREVR